MGTYLRKKTACAVLRMFLLTLRQSGNLSKPSSTNPIELVLKIGANPFPELGGDSLRCFSNLRLSSAQIEAGIGSFHWHSSMRLDWGPG